MVPITWVLLASADHQGKFTARPRPGLVVSEAMKNRLKTQHVVKSIDFWLFFDQAAPGSFPQQNGPQWRPKFPPSSSVSPVLHGSPRFSQPLPRRQPDHSVKNKPFQAKKKLHPPKPCKPSLRPENVPCAPFTAPIRRPTPLNFSL
ncbi:hypothetical protein [Pseudomonas fluorescens]|uniref:hypothetical protein n=1 Tax=Pseudomonas fluorescens TaxID=294 RepID=UPI00177C2269|nr:hypothetical protein [Pseudomonas fluorescens]